MGACSKMYILKMFFGLVLLLRIFNDVEDKFFFFVIFFKHFVSIVNGLPVDEI